MAIAVWLAVLPHHEAPPGQEAPIDAQPPPGVDVRATGVGVEGRELAEEVGLA